MSRRMRASTGSVMRSGSSIQLLAEKFVARSTLTYAIRATSQRRSQTASSVTVSSQGSPTSRSWMKPLKETLGCRIGVTQRMSGGRFGVGEGQPHVDFVQFDEFDDPRCGEIARAIPLPRKVSE